MHARERIDVGVVLLSARGGKKIYGRQIDGSAVSVRCPELGGVRFLEVSNASVLR